MWRSCEQGQAKTGKKTRPNSTILFRLAPAGRACRNWEKDRLQNAHCSILAALSGLRCRDCLFRAAFRSRGGSDDAPGSRYSSGNTVLLQLQQYDFGFSGVPRRCHYRWALVPLSLPATLTLDRWEDCPAIVTAPERRWPEHLATKGPPCVICPLPALGLRCLQPA
jgi:hypothetical protein